MSTIQMTPVAVVVGGRSHVVDDDWGGVTAVVRLDAAFPPDCLAGLDDFSHVEVVFVFDRVDPEGVERGARHPRGRPDWPQVGIFAQRAKDRPNRIGITRARVLKVEGLDVHVQGLDAVDGTPVLDLKPVMREFEPLGPVEQPAWATELMTGYW